VLSANQHRRQLSKSQRAAVAAKMIPELSEDLQQERAQKIRETLKSMWEGGILLQSAGSPPQESEEPLARDTAANLMGVSGQYAQRALEVLRADPSLFERIWSGELTVTAALRELRGETDTALVQQVKSFRTRLNALLRRVDQHPDLLAELGSVLERYEGED